MSFLSSLQFNNLISCITSIFAVEYHPSSLKHVEQHDSSVQDIVYCLESPNLNWNLVFLKNYKGEHIHFLQDSSKTFLNSGILLAFMIFSMRSSRWNRRKRCFIIGSSLGIEIEEQDFLLK